MNLRIAGFVVVGALVFGSICFIAAGGRISFGRDDAWSVDLNTMGNFPLDSDNATDADIPGRFRQLDGKTVSIEGFILANQPFEDLPVAGSKPLCKFQVVYNINPSNRWDRKPVQKRVFATLAAGTPTDMPDVSQEVRVTGILHVGIQRDPLTKALLSVYRMDVRRVEPI